MFSPSRVVNGDAEMVLAKRKQLDGSGATPTASELAADLVFEGPADLSTNPKHMTGYGL